MANKVNHIYGGFMEQVLYRREYRWQRAVASFPLGRMRQLAHYPGACAKPPVYLCGDYWLGPSLECAVISGLNASELALADF